MRTRFAVLGAALLLGVPACSKPAESSSAVLPPVKIVEPPAASAGGACILWDWDFIEEMIGLRFSVAASGWVDETSTCVVQNVSNPWPDLSLSVVETTKADAALFAAERIPAKATKLKGLGKAAYRLNSKAANGHGPTVEIGWLSEANQLQTLRFRFARGAKAADVKAMNAKLLGMAKAMSTTNG